MNVCMLLMLCFDGIDVSEGIGNCHYWYFLIYSFKFQQNVCNRCHDLLMSMTLKVLSLYY